ncbi:MAG: glucose 1-dehydrogenase [Pseudomonadota bacterium]|nr:glucose 1-dehydrogenase [Pseudomonadota bacterium]
MRLKDKTAVITGAGSGFGAGIAQKFSDEGAKVIVVDINESGAKKIASQINGTPFVADVSNDSSINSLVSFVIKMNDKIDILVNNAGVTHLPNSMEAISEQEFDKILSVNVKSVFLTARHVIPLFKKQRSGVILNIASTAGISPRPNLTWYNASKGWMITATKSMAAELASHGVRVNALNPVAGETPLLKAFLGQDTPEMRQKFLSSIPLGRFSTPKDIAEAALFLCSEESSLITGVALEVDGGRCI